MEKKVNNGSIENVLNDLEDIYKTRNKESLVNFMRDNPEADHIMGDANAYDYENACTVLDGEFDNLTITNTMKFNMDKYRLIWDNY